jgi:hypothetical protein
MNKKWSPEPTLKNGEYPLSLMSRKKIKNKQNETFNLSIIYLLFPFKL